MHLWVFATLSEQGEVHGGLGVQALVSVDISLLWSGTNEQLGSRKRMSIWLQERFDDVVDEVALDVA